MSGEGGDTPSPTSEVIDKLRYFQNKSSDFVMKCVYWTFSTFFVNYLTLLDQIDVIRKSKIQVFTNLEDTHSSF